MKKFLFSQRDVVGEAVTALEENFNVRFSRDQAKILVREARKSAAGQSVDMPTVLETMTETYSFRG